LVFKPSYHGRIRWFSDVHLFNLTHFHLTILMMILFVSAFPEGWWFGFPQGCWSSFLEAYPSGIPKGWSFPSEANFAGEGFMPKELADSRGSGPFFDRDEPFIPEFMEIRPCLGGADANLGRQRGYGWEAITIFAGISGQATVGDLCSRA